MRPVAPPADGATGDVVTRVRAQVAAALAGVPAVLVAASGGRDSTVLLDAVLAVAADRVAGVATFDHGTGPGARDAVAHVRALGRALGVRVVAGRARAAAGHGEAAWRAARWRFLRRAARACAVSGVPPAVATGHTEDDQLETVFMRVLRGAGPRGLAGMLAPARGVVRPLLDVPASDVAAYAEARGLAWVEDVSNASMAHLRNRVRRKILPSATAANPALRRDLLAVARAAATWRAEVERAAAALVDESAGDSARIVVPLARLMGYDADALAVLWPALAARAGVRLERRGTARLAAFTSECVRRRAAGEVPRGRVPLAGGALASVELHGPSPERAMVLRRRPDEPSEAPAPVALDAAALAHGVAFGRWRFASAPPVEAAESWRVWLPAAFRYVVRAWRPGDRMRAGPGGAARRVKRYLADQRVPAARRLGWPVVVALPAPSPDASSDAEGGEIVWIPGVRRSPAAPARPGQSGFDLHCWCPTP